MELMFFDWHRPAFLTDVALEIITRYRTGKRLDLANIVLSLPSARAQSRLEEILVSQVEFLIEKKELDADWIPPVFMTIGHVPELLYPLKNTLANSLTQALAWRKAFVEVATQVPEQFAQFMPGGVPDDFLRQLTLAQIPAKLHSELAADGKMFETVTQECQRRGIAAEVDRWTFLSRLETRYFQILDDLRYWDVQTARLVALDRNECHTTREIYVVGAPDLNTVQKRILNAVSEHVHVFVCASQTQQDRFDEFGCVIPERWTSDVLDIPDDIIVQADKAPDLVPAILDRICRCAAEFDKQQSLPSDKRFSLFRKEVALCIPDDLETELTPYLKESLAANNLSLEPAAGVPGTQNRIYRLLTSLADWLETRRFSSLAELVRHPDLEHYINLAMPSQQSAPVEISIPKTNVKQQLFAFEDFETQESVPESPDSIAGEATHDAEKNVCDWLTLLDRYQREFLPEQLDDLTQAATTFADGVASKHMTNYADLAAVFTILDDLFKPFYHSRPDGTSYIAKTSEHKPAQTDDLQVQADQVNLDSEEADVEFTAESIGQILDNTPQIRRLVYQQALSLREWCTLVSEFLQRVYASIIPKLSEVPDETSQSEISQSRSRQDEMLDRKYHQVASGFLCVNASLSELASVPEALSQAVTGTEMLRLLLDQMKTRQLSSFHEPRLLCQVGWLDLRLDDAPHVLIAGMNEGTIPTSQTTDQFLPDSLRHQLHLEDNGRRFARDLYSLATILASRPDTLLLTARRTVNGEPLRPSRFLFLTSQANLPKRVCRLFSSGGHNDVKTDTATTIPPDSLISTHSGFALPSLRMPSPAPPSMLNVTAFRSFLASPYVFFLKNGLGLEPQSDDDQELDAASFGSVLHEIVGRFGSYHVSGRPVCDSTDADEIYRFLSWQLDDYMKNRFRQDASPAVAIQQEQIRNTLYHFSRWQSLWRQNGNEILWVEKAPKLNVVFSAGGPPMRIHGRIDRIDYNRETNTLYVFDYKTYSSSKIGNIQEADTLLRDSQTNTLLFSNATGNKADEDHRVLVKNEPDHWTNLQLPLYHHIAKQLIRENRAIFAGDTKIRTGYIMLLRNTQTTALGVPWQDKDYSSADTAIRWVIQTIRRLWPQEICPNDLIDPEKPELGTIWNPKTSVPDDDLWFITGGQTSR